MGCYIALFLAALFAYAHCMCPDGWVSYDTSCYWDSDDTASSWDMARSKCALKEANLADIHNQEDNDFIARMAFGAGKWLWIGVHHEESCEGYVYESSGQKITYANWNKDEQNKNNKLDCVMMGYMGLWEPSNCDQEQYFICESNYEISSGCLDLEVKTHSFSYNGHYYLAVGTTKTYDEAKNECQEMDSYLVEINNDDENKYLHEKIYEYKNGKFDLIDTVIQRRYLSGNDKRVEGRFEWAYEEYSPMLVFFTNWSPGEPNNKKHQFGDEDCMEMLYSGKWNDVDCNVENKYICTFLADLSTTTMKEEEGTTTPEYDYYSPL